MSDQVDDIVCKKLSTSSTWTSTDSMAIDLNCSRQQNPDAEIIEYGSDIELLIY